MKAPKCIFVDFESDPIWPRPNYPPKPCGVSIKRPGDRRSTYYAWGHATNNNCTLAQGRAVIRDVWRSGYPLCFHHAKFDVDVAETFMGAPRISWDRIHDTLYLLFLFDPYARSLSLKPSAERILDMPSKERDAVREWLVEHNVHVHRKPSTWGEHIPEAPGDLVGRYADGDVIRTEKLFNKLWPDICDRGMRDAYDRERKLMPLLLENEREGVRANIDLLEQDIKIYTGALERADAWLKKRLRAPDLNINSDQDMADALEARGIVTEWNYTAPSKRHPQGVRSVSKKNLTADMFNDRKVASVFGYRNILSTCLNTFMAEWFRVGSHSKSHGMVFTTWNQVRQPERGGARTGRLSSSPPRQNIPKNWKKAISDGYIHPKFLGVPDLPNMRQYFLPDKGHNWGRRDWNQQELRFLAHFEDGDLLKSYQDDPRLDIHNKVQEYIWEIVGLDLPREPVKILNFADIYGRGLGALATAMHVDVATAQRLRKAKNALLPGVAELARAISDHGKAGLPIRTWGGREYFAEPPHFSKKHKRMMDFYYKLLNYLVQGSSADAMKESIIRYHAASKRLRNGDARYLISVHDENNISAQKSIFKKEMLLLREVMQSIETDVPMLSDGEGGKDWGHLKALKEPS